MESPRCLIVALLIGIATIGAAGCGTSSTQGEAGSSAAARARSTTAIRQADPEITVTTTGVLATSGTSEQSATTTTTTTTTTTSTTSTTEIVPSTTAVPTTTSLPTEGSGIFVWASDAGEPVGRAPYRTYQVGVELGSGLDPDVVAAVVEVILGDKRSWIGDGKTGFRRVVDGGSLRVVIATPDTVDRLCAPLRTNGWLSCAQGRYAAINLHRWLTATDEWDAPLIEYWRYVINHEMGHQVGKGHRYCPGEGRMAPVMQQQTKTLDGCRANGWPYPDDRAG